MFNKSYIVYAKRSAVGRFGGSLAPIRVDDLLAEIFKDFKNQNLFPLEEIDDIITGCANQAGEDNRNIARMSSVLAGLPFSIPATTINRLCGSSLDATIDAVARIESGFNDCILVGGAESMSRAPYVMSKSDSAFGRTQKIWDTSIGWRFPNKKMEEIFPLFGMGETAEEVANQYKISRDEQDKYAFNSHQKALQAIKEKRFVDEIVPINVELRKKSYTFNEDEGPRADTSVEKLAKLRPAFRQGGTVTAGNSSSINDGAAALLVVSENFLKKHQLTPLAKVTGAGIAGLHPNVMGLGPIHATNKLMQKANKKISDFDLVELNEAFAAQSLACLKELELDQNKVNVNGGSIAIGHPLGCSGARILTTLLYALKNQQKTTGLATMCIGVGQGIALSVERV